MPRPRSSLLVVGLFMVLVSGVDCSRGRRESPEERFLRHFAADLQPLEKEASYQRWRVSFSGAEAALGKLAAAEKKICDFYGDAKTFNELIALRGKKQGTPEVQRQLDILYDRALPYQAPRPLLDAMSSLARELNQEYRALRFIVRGAELGIKEAGERLARSSQSDERRECWESLLKSLGPLEPKFRHLISLRNQAARALHFQDYFDISLSINGVDEEEFLALLDRLEFLSAPFFADLMADASERMARLYRIPVDELRPWHYADPFSLNKSLAVGSDVDALFQNRDPVQIGLDFFRALGTDLTTVVQRSALDKQKTEESRAFKILVDREYDYSLLLKPMARWEGPKNYDVRIIMNVAPTADSMLQVLHEMGHSAYLENTDKRLPYLLREEAGLPASEGVAIYFGGLIYDVSWLESVLGLSADDVRECRAGLGRQNLSHQISWLREWLHHLRFTQALYENPEQDLNALWRRLGERFQGIKAPEGWDQPDFLLHLDYVNEPIFEQHFVFGALMSAQIRHYLNTACGGSGSGRFDWPGVGRFFKDKIFSLGATYPWPELVERATGEKLNPDYFFSGLAAR